MLEGREGLSAFPTAGRVMDEDLTDVLGEAAEALGGLQAGLARLAVSRNDPWAAAEMLACVQALSRIGARLGCIRAMAVAGAGAGFLSSLEHASPPPAALAPLSAMIERLGSLLAEVAEGRTEPEGDDQPLIDTLGGFAARLRAAVAAPPVRGRIAA
jgi:hypothetical protein